MDEIPLPCESKVGNSFLYNELSLQGFLVDLDQMQPSQRLEKLIELAKKDDRQIVRQGLYLALICLYVVDEVMRDAENTDYFFYIQDDYSILNLLEMSGYSVFTQDAFNVLVIQLGLAQLVYRFNAAKKFRIYNTNTKQLRLNSWGRSILSDGILSDMSEIVTKISRIYRAYYEDNIHLYRELTSLLLAEITPISAMRIQELNKELKIKLVS